MDIVARNDRRFEVVIGNKAPDVVLPAMPIRIHYLDAERDYSLETNHGEPIFVMRVPDNFTPGWDTHSWDAYKLREAFEELRTPEEAWRLLNVIGTFRYKRRTPKGVNALTWKELKGWQGVIRRLRLRDSSEWFPLLASREQGSKDLFRRMLATAGLDDLYHQIWSVSDETYWWLQGIPQGLSICRDRYLSQREIKEIFSVPGAKVSGSLPWQQARAVLKRRRAQRARGNPEGKQALIAEVTPATALDAILATVYVDKLRGLDLQVCALKECTNTFERLSDTRKMYCTNYHAHLASLRRKRAEAKNRRLKRQTRKEKAKNESL
jgi:hypothetical protein